MDLQKNCMKRQKNINIGQYWMKYRDSISLTSYIYEYILAMIENKAYHVLHEIWNYTYCRIAGTMHSDMVIKKTK